MGGRPSHGLAATTFLPLVPSAVVVFVVAALDPVGRCLFLAWLDDSPLTRVLEGTGWIRLTRLVG